MKINDKHKTIFGITTGSMLLIAFYLYFQITGNGLDQLKANEFLSSIFLLGMVLLMYGSAYYAQIKGYTFLYGFVSILFPFGLLLLFALKDKTKKSEPNVSANSDTAAAESE